MSLVLESVCEKLALPLADNSATRLVASKIIELAQRGVHDANTLSAMTLKEFKHYCRENRLLDAKGGPPLFLTYSAVSAVKHDLKRRDWFKVNP
jgi:hypothetical protein